MNATTPLRARARCTFLAAFACLTATVASGALAQAVTTSAVNVRAGPDRFFPTVTWVLSGNPPRCTAAWTAGAGAT